MWHPGEIIAGGRQDRMISQGHDPCAFDTKGSVHVPAMCVEEGRWSRKGEKVRV